MAAFWDTDPWAYCSHDLNWPFRITWRHRSRDHSIPHR